MGDLANSENIGEPPCGRSPASPVAKAFLCTSLVVFALAALPSLAAASYPTLAPLVTGTSATPTSNGAKADRDRLPLWR